MSHNKKSRRIYEKVLNGGILLLSLVVLLLMSGCLGTMTEEATSTSLATLSPIAITTDKKQYVNGETVTLTVTNKLDVSVWYISYPQPDMAFWDLEKVQSNDWQTQNFRLPRTEESQEVCRIIMYERPFGVVTELKSHSNLIYKWKQKTCPFKTAAEPFETETIERGKYRFIFHYSLNTVKSENIESEPWKRPIELDETKIVHSNEFDLK